MKTFNKIQILGNVGKDAEIRYTSSEMPILKFSIADTFYKKNDNGKYDNNTTWHDVVVFGKFAESLNNKIRKGDSLFVEGRLDKKEYTDKNNIKRYGISVIASNIIILVSRNSEENKSTTINENSFKQTQDTEFYDEDIPF